MDDNAASLFAINALAVWVIGITKKLPWIPWINAEAEKANRIFSALIAALASAGLMVHLTHTGAVESGTAIISWTGITTPHIVGFLYHWAANFATQKTIYKFWKLAKSNGNGRPQITPVRQAGPAPVTSVGGTKA